MKRHKWLLTLLLAVFLLGGGAFLLWQTGFFSSVGSLEEMRKLYRTLCALFPPVLFPDSTALGGDRTHSQQRDGAGWGGALWNVALIPDDLVGSGGRSVLVFWLARVLGQRFVERLVNQRVADKYLEVIRRKRDYLLILVFLFPFSRTT